MGNNLIMYKTLMKEMPNTCMDCSMVICNKPMGKDGNFRELYKHSRHEECPLVKVKPRGDK